MVLYRSSTPQKTKSKPCDESSVTASTFGHSHIESSVVIAWVSRRRLFKPARMPKSDAPTDARVKWGRMLLDAREARKCYKMLDKFSPFFYTSATSRVCARSNQLVANSRPAVSSSRPAVFQQFFGTFWYFRSS